MFYKISEIQKYYNEIHKWWQKGSSYKTKGQCIIENLTNFSRFLQKLYM